MVFPILPGGTPHDGTSVEVFCPQWGGKLSGVKNISFGIDWEYEKVQLAGGGFAATYTPGRPVAQPLTIEFLEYELNNVVNTSGGQLPFFSRMNANITITLRSDLGIALKTITLGGVRPKTINRSYSTDDVGNLTATLTCEVLNVYENGPLEASIGQALQLVRQLL